jgi:hypothetical protein
VLNPAVTGEHGEQSTQGGRSMQLPITGPQAQVVSDETAFLIGRPPLGEYLGFLSQTLESQTLDQADLASRWRDANDHVRQLEQSEVGWADSPQLGELPKSLEPLRDQVLRDPTVKRAFAIVPVDIAIVELDKLVVFQKHINLAYAGSLRAVLPGDATDVDLFRFGLPFDGRHDPEIHGGQIGQNVWAFSSPSTDMRVLELRRLDPSEVPGFVTGGIPAAIIAAVVGYGSNYLNAIHVDNRLVLNNGSHRAYALREAGYTHAPCLIQKVSRREELEIFGNAELNLRPDVYLTDTRPPLLKDYFDPELRMLVHVPRKHWQVRVAVQSEAFPSPAA